MDISSGDSRTALRASKAFAKQAGHAGITVLGFGDPLYKAATKALRAKKVSTLKRGKNSVNVRSVDDGDDWILSLPLFAPLPQLTRLAKGRKGQTVIQIRFLAIWLA